MHLKNDEESVQYLEEIIFPNIYNENVILFLGAGFSYTKEKNYLGATILNYYQELLKVDLETKDLVEFVDRASRLDSFSRNQFDQYVNKLLQKLNPEEAHQKVVTMGWRQIVTTNLDLLLENAYSQIIGKSEEYKEIIPIRSVSEYQSSVSNDQIKYIKLNGCLSDISKYKMVFSTQDFSENKQFYNLVLSNFSSLSNDVSFLSIGYSFTDGISKRLLTELNKNNLKNDKKVFNVDPFPNEAIIPYLEENNVITIRMTAAEFFGHYDNWMIEKFKRTEKKLPKAYFKGNENTLQINTRLKLRLINKLKQLHKNNQNDFLRPENYYKGEEPNYSIILDGHDVLKKDLTKKIIDSIKASKIVNNLIPVNFIVGSHGIGKSTSAYRALSELQSNHGYTAFELIDINGLRAQDLEELFNASSTENIVLLADNVERHIFFKELMNFRLSLSEYQFNRNISILAPIRENMLEKNLKAYSYQNTSKIIADHELTNEEIDDLIGKLKKYKLITVRDKHEENKIKNQIKTNYNSDPYVTMLSIIENSTLLRAVSDTLSLINSEAQIAFEYTSLLYQYKIPMPASIMKKIINMDWDEFKNNILKVDCKGLLINKMSAPSDIKEDLVFTTKHRIISSKFILSKYKSEDKLIKAYLKIVHSLNPNDEHAKLIIDLVKALKKDRIFTKQDKIAKLYDEAAKIFITNPIFNIHYAMNLQSRNNISALMKASERLMQVDSSIDYRNHSITHRRGVLDFNIAKHYHKEGNTYLRDEYLDSAREFFEIKRSVDPFSSYSYYDFLVLEIWKIQHLDMLEDEVLRQHIVIQDLFLKAYESVIENADFILRLRSKYVNEIKSNQFSKAEILKQLEELYANSETRVLALIFKLNTLETSIFDFGENFLPQMNSEDIVEELESYNHLDIVQKALFDYHCNRLFNIDSRMALNNINQDQFEKENYFKYHYYSFIKECYNLQFAYGEKHLESLRREFRYLNPSVQEIWVDEDSKSPKKFIGIIKNDSLYKIYIHILGKAFLCLKSDFKIVKGQEYYCNIIFTVRGIRVKLLGEK